MKNKITLFIAALFMSITSLMAQSPDMINYQGVAHNLNGSAIANQNIKVRLKIRNNTNVGAVKYSEVRSVTTDASGLFNIQIGSAGALSTTGTWASINWESGAKFLQVEMDPTGGNTFINMGTQQLVSVPYAQHAKQADGLAPNKFLPYSQIDTTYAKAGYFMKHDGFSWGPSSFLPYNVADPNLVSFAITNTSAVGGQAIYGMNTVNATNATGVRGECNKANGRGVYGKANGASAFGVLGDNPLGVGIQGTSNAVSYGAVLGQNTIAGGKGVVGIANTGTTSMGVEGNANAGIGVSGYSNTFRGVSGGSISGTALYGNSSSGYALETNGKVKISGGNTTPGAGKVLTSDASGNATWQTPAAAPKVAFKTAMATASIPSGQTANVNWTSELYDLNNNFDMATKVFTVPVSGVYHFDAAFNFNLSSVVYNLIDPQIIIELNHNGTLSYLSRNDGVLSNISTNSQAHCSASVDARLQAGDQVFVQVIQSNGGALTATQGGATDPSVHYFCGHLIIAD